MQTRLTSFVEALANTSTGLILAWCITYYVLPRWFDINVTKSDSILITGIFTIASIVRQYLWRRLFNRIKY